MKREEREKEKGKKKKKRCDLIDQKIFAEVKTTRVKEYHQIIESKKNHEHKTHRHERKDPLEKPRQN